MTDEAESLSGSSLEGVILRGVGGSYLVSCGESGLCLAKPRGIFRKDGISPLPGDRVGIGPSGDPEVPWRIDTILPRRNLLTRPAMANLDLLVVMASAASPSPDLPLVDKLLCIAAASGIDTILCISKRDLQEDRADEIAELYRTAGFETWCCSFPAAEAPEGLLERMKGRTVAFAGQSGVGKSTLLNSLLGSTRMATGSVSVRIGRGRHTTRHAELFPLPYGGFLADTPGFSQLEITESGIGVEGLLDGYPEISCIEGTCRFTGCHHTGELGCVVPALVSAGSVDPERLERYRAFRKMIDSVKHYDAPAGSQASRSRR